MEGPHYAFHPYGVFPAPVAATADVGRLVQLFELLGRFLGRAVLDSRLIDLPLNPVFYAWLLGRTASLGLHDLKFVDENLYLQLVKMTELSGRRQAVQDDATLVSRHKGER